MFILIRNSVVNIDKIIDIEMQRENDKSYKVLVSLEGNCSLTNYFDSEVEATSLMEEIIQKLDTHSSTKVIRFGKFKYASSC